MDGLRRGHDRNPHAFRRLRQFARREVAATAPLPTIPAAPLRTEFPAPTSASRLAPVVTAAIATIITPAPVVTLPTLARRFFVTGLR